MFESKINRGKANGYAPLDGSGKVSLSHLPDVVGQAGTSGTSGVNGTSGINGTNGVNGSSGETGTAGSSGTSGVNGTSGTSAFENIDITSFATTGSNQFNGNQSISGSLLVSVSTGVPSGISNWEGDGGWNQGSYTNVTASGGTGTGLTVDVAAGGAGYININAISINTPGSGYTNGDVVTINNENNLPGQFTVEVEKINTLQVDGNGNLILDIDNVPANPIGSIGDIVGTLKINHNSIYFATQSFVPETYQITVNPGITYNTHVTIPKNQGIPELYSGGWSITTQDDTTYVLTGVYSAGSNWDCEIDDLNSNYNGGTQTMTLTWLDYEPTDIWGKIDFGFEKGKFVENVFTSSFVTNSQTSSFVTNSQTSSFVIKTNVPTTSSGSLGDVAGMFAMDSTAMYYCTRSWSGGTQQLTSFVDSYVNAGLGTNYHFSLTDVDLRGWNSIAPGGAKSKVIRYSTSGGDTILNFETSFNITGTGNQTWTFYNPIQYVVTSGATSGTWFVPQSFGVEPQIGWQIAIVGYGPYTITGVTEDEFSNWVITTNESVGAPTGTTTFLYSNVSPNIWVRTLWSTGTW